MKKFYERYWEKEKEEVLGDFKYKWPIIKHYIPKEKNLKVLDFGCGKGAITSEILKINPYLEVSGVDVSSQALKLAQKKLKKQNFFKIEDGKKLPFKTNSFDFIMATDVLEHVLDTENAFSELARVLKPKGKILITVPYNGFIKNLVITLFYFDTVFDPYSAHIRFFTKKTLQNCLREVKLKTIRTKFFGRFYPLPRGMFVLALK